MEYLELIKIALPALLVLLACYLTMTRFIERQPRPNETTNNAIRMKSYERLTLYLERITPENLIQRIDAPNMNCVALQKEMLKVIRQEYEHNLTQQLYVSKEAWDAVLIAKEGIKQLINASMESLAPDAPSIELAKVIINAYHGTASNPVELSIRVLKHDIDKMLGYK